MTTLEVIDWFRNIALTQPGFSTVSGQEVGAFITGDSLALNDISATPLVYLERPFQTSIKLRPTPLYVEYLLQWQVLDQELSEGSNRDAVLSRCQAIGVSMVNSIYMNKPESMTIPEQMVDTVELWRSGADLWVGVRFEMQIQVPLSTDGCDVID